MCLLLPRLKVTCRLPVSRNHHVMQQTPATHLLGHAWQCWQTTHGAVCNIMSLPGTETGAPTYLFHRSPITGSNHVPHWILSAGSSVQETGLQWLWHLNGVTHSVGCADLCQAFLVDLATVRVSHLNPHAPGPNLCQQSFSSQSSCP